MARIAIPMLALALGAALAVGLVSCGGRDEEGLLPGENAQQIVDNLNQVEQDVANGDCDLALQHAEEVQAQIDDLGGDVDAQLRQRLEDGAEELVALIPDQCEEATTTLETTTEETTTEETTTDEEKPKSTSTTTTTTEPTTTTTTTTEPPTAGEGGGVVPPGQTETDDSTGTGQGTGTGTGGGTG